MQTIPLNALTVSNKYNVRVTERENGLEELIASIKAHGLLENLLVIKSDNDNFEVIGGGRRLSALKILQRQGYITDNYTVPCEIVAEENAVEISLAENMVRVTMHPADQFEAWARLVENGMNIRDIALRFGVNEKLVAQRLKLGRLSQTLMAAYRAGLIKIDSLMAFTLSDDTEKQDELYNRIKDSWTINNPNVIRTALTETSVSGNHRLAKFIGEAAYKEAGGIIHHDLFSEKDGNYFDKELLTFLTKIQLQEKADELQDKWGWIEVSLDFGYEEKARYHTIRAQLLGEIPEELSGRFEEVESMLNEIDNNDGSSGEEDALHKEYNELEARIDEYYGYSEEEYSISGCVITVDKNGNLEVHAGLVRPEDKKHYLSESSTEKTAKEKSRYSNTLADRLRNYRLHSVKKAMANDFATAFDSALYVMCLNSFNKRYINTSWLATKAAEYIYPFDKDETGEAIKKNEVKLFKKLPLEWLSIEDEKERFAALCALDEIKKQKLFAACVAKSLTPQLSIDKNASPAFEFIVERMKVDVALDVRPTADNFFNKVVKAESLSTGKEIFGESFITKYQSKPKGDIVSILHRAFDNPEQKAHTKEQREKLKSWLPEGM